MSSSSKGRNATGSTVCYMLRERAGKMMQRISKRLWLLIIIVGTIIIFLTALLGVLTDELKGKLTGIFSSLPPWAFWIILTIGIVVVGGLVTALSLWYERRKAASESSEAEANPAPASLKVSKRHRLSPEVLYVLIHTLQTDPDPNVRANAVERLAEAERPAKQASLQVLRALIHTLQTDPDPNVHDKAARGLAELRYDKDSLRR